MSKRWTPEEHKLLLENLLDGTTLSFLQSLIPARTQGAIQMEASRSGFRLQTIDGVAMLFEGIKRRDRRLKKDSDEDILKSYSAVNKEENLHDIIPSKCTNIVGFNINEMAVKILMDQNLPYDAQVIYDLSQYLIRCNIRGLSCQQPLILPL